LGGGLSIGSGRVFDANVRPACGPAIQANGGKVLVRTVDAVEALEAGRKQCTVVIEFESFERAIAAYRSDAYQTALQALGSAPERDFRIVEGVE
jgi:uncharacterized protein (DUF1330 family)